MNNHNHGRTKLIKEEKIEDKNKNIKIYIIMGYFFFRSQVYFLIIFKKKKKRNKIYRV